VETECLFLLELCEGNMEGGSFTGNSERYVKEGSGKAASPSIWGLHKGILKGGLLYWGLQEPNQGRIWKWSISLFTEAP
jgi:hypothetical protein